MMKRPAKWLKIPVGLLALFLAPATTMVKVEDATAALTRPLAPVVDVTAESGAHVIGKVTSWHVRRGSQNVEYLAGRSSSQDLLVFSWSPGAGRWSVENVTSQTGKRIAGALTDWITPDGPYTVEHLAGRGPAGELLVFYRSTRNNRWRVVDVTAKTGRRVADTLTSWLTPNGPYIVEHVAGRDANGNLLVFWWSPARDWQVVDVTAKTGARVASPVTSWQASRSGVVTEYVAGSSSDGSVTVFSWSPVQDWRAQLLSERLIGGVTAWMTGPVEHLAGARTDGSLVVLWRNGPTFWRAVDVTAITGEHVQGRPTVYQLRDGTENVEILGSLGTTGQLVVHWWKPSHDWQALSLTELTGQSIATLPEGWLSSTENRTVEHLAAVGSDGHLRVFYSFDQPRTLTDAVGAQYDSIQRMRNKTRKVLVVLWDPHYPNVPSRPSAAEIADAVFGGGRSVRRYFLENSGGVFTITSAGTLGWYEADRPLSYYDDPEDPHDKMGAALEAADPDFDFRAHDSDGDGTLEPQELAIVFAHPGGPGGLQRSGGRSIKDPDGGPLVLDGVTISVGSEVAIGNPANLSVVAHELSHLMLGLPDMYFTFFTPTAAGKYSLMDSTYDGTHIDAFNKLKLGWAHPRIIFRSGRYHVPNVETRHRVLVLMEPNRSTVEYFLVENRWRGTSFDVAMPDQGLAVWHIMESPAVFDAAPPPPTVSMSMWATLGTGQGAWGRKAVRMIRPVLTQPFDDARALWDVSEGELVSNQSDPARPALRWGDGTPSGFALRNLGSAAQDMEVTIEVP